MLVQIRIIALFTFCLLSHGFSYGQIDFEILSPKKMNKDLTILLETLDGHPDPYTKTSKEDFDQIIDDVRSNITQPLDILDYYKELQKIVAGIKDGHTNLFMPRRWLQNKRRKHGVLPYEVYLTNNNELHIIKSYAEAPIELGAQIMEINGMPVDSFINYVDPFLSYETLPFRNDRISQSFEFLLYLTFKQVDQLTFKLKVVNEFEMTVATIPFKEWESQKNDTSVEREKKIENGEIYDFQIVSPGVAKIDIFSFAVSNLDKYQFFLRKTFKQIRNNDIHSLIIDLRGNYGGWPKASSELFHYIHNGHFKTMGKTSMKISQAYRKSYTDRYPNISQAAGYFHKSRHFIDLNKILTGKIDTYAEEDIFFNEKPTEKRFEFEGDCYVLIDRKSYSAASSFAATFQCYSMGYLIGEPTGGTKIFRANPFIKILPKSSMIARVSSTKMYSTCYNLDDEPVTPNVVSRPTVIDLVHNNDSQLNTALMLIKKVQNSKVSQEP